MLIKLQTSLMLSFTFALFIEISSLIIFRYSTDFSQNTRKNISKSNSFFQYHFEIFKFHIESNLIVSNRNRIVSYQFSVSIFQSRPCLIPKFCLSGKKHEVIKLTGVIFTPKSVIRKARSRAFKWCLQYGKNHAKPGL